MNGDMLLEQRLRATLDEVPQLSDHVLAIALERVAVTTQRRPRRLRFRLVRPVWAIAATLVAAVVVAGSVVIGSAALPRLTDDAAVGALPGTGSWSGQIPLGPGNWSYGSSTLLPDGRVLILGFDRGAMEALVWDPASGTIAPAGTVDGDTRESHSATLLPDGRVLIAGGLHGSHGDGPIGTALIWDPASGAFTATRPLVTRRSRHLAVGLDHGRVLVLGGNGDRTAETYEPDYGGFTTLDIRSELDTYAVATRLVDGRVLVLGYARDGRCTEIWDASAANPSVSTPLEGGCQARSATLLADGRVLVMSSSAETGEPAYTPETRMEVTIFDPMLGSFAPSGSTTEAVDRAVALALDDGRVLIAGGYGPDGRTTAAADIWDPATNVVTPTAPMTTPRAQAGATLLDDGRVLVVGGWDVEVRPDGSGSGSAISSLEVFDPR
jgi:hypothetical protein